MSHFVVQFNSESQFCILVKTVAPENTDPGLRNFSPGIEISDSHPKNQKQKRVSGKIIS